MFKNFKPVMVSGLIVVCLLLVMTNSGFAEVEKKEQAFKLPDNVISISNNNTYSNISEDYQVVEPSNSTKKLIETVEIPIENPDLIKMLNETSIKTSPISIGYRGMIYLGRWPLNYSSESVSTTWDYQAINSNEINNIGGNEVLKIRYIQQAEKIVKGALSNKVDDPDTIREMMLQKTKEYTGLPLSFTTVVGANTKLENIYHVPANKVATLQAYIPAINEKGKMTFGEVYIELKGSKKKLIIKNVTKQGVGAWIPIQDHVSFQFYLN